MKRRLTMFAAAGALAAGLMFAQAPATPQRGNHHSWKASGMMFRQRMAQALNLTDAQKAQAKSIFQETRQSTQALRDQLKENRAALTAAMKANDTAGIERLSAKQGSLVGKLTAARTEAMAKFYKVLTPEQKAKADQMHQAFRQRMQQRMHHNG